jgi:cell division transport system permease protein
MRAKYVLSEVMVGLWRNVTMTVAMIITMAVSLTMLGASLILFKQVGEMENYYGAKVEVAIYLKSDVTDDQRTALRTKLEADGHVKKPINYETKQQAYDKFKKEFKDAPDLVDATKPESLPESFRVKTAPGASFDQVKLDYATDPAVSRIINQKDLLSKVFGVLNSLQTLALVVAIVQGVAALLLVGNTIQVAAYSRRREVGVMKLVGASNWFIQAPFVLEAMFAGVIGAVIASLALVAAKEWLIDGSLSSLTSLVLPVHWGSILSMIPVLIGIGAVVSGITGWITLRFYIKK